MRETMRTSSIFQRNHSVVDARLHKRRNFIFQGNRGSYDRTNESTSPVLLLNGIQAIAHRVLHMSVGEEPDKSKAPESTETHAHHFQLRNDFLRVMFGQTWPQKNKSIALKSVITGKARQCRGLWRQAQRTAQTYGKGNRVAVLAASIGIGGKAGGRIDEGKDNKNK